MIHVNMTLLIPLNNSTNISVKVDSVNELGLGENHFRICSDCDDIDEVELLIALNLANETFEIEDN